jgi:uncharacterized membrane protein YqjE
VLIVVLMDDLNRALGALFISNLGLIVTLVGVCWKVSSIVTSLQVRVDILMRAHERREDREAH